VAAVHRAHATLAQRQFVELVAVGDEHPVSRLVLGPQVAGDQSVEA
jgi:hypothetical protein